MEPFEELYNHYYPTVYAYALKLCRDDAAAEELTQETFCRALRRIDTFRGECRLGTWLCRIARNTWYTQCAQRKRQCELSPELPDPDADPELMLADRDTAARVHAALHELEEPYREVFWMRAFGELPFREIGRLHGKTEAWARVTYHRAKMKLKEAIE